MLQVVICVQKGAAKKITYVSYCNCPFA